MNRKTTDLAVLLIRLVLGLVFFVHGAQKVFGWFGGPGLKGFAGYLTSQGMPAVIPYLVSFGELAAGLGLVAGLLTRIAAAGMALEMFGTVFLVHWKNGFLMNWNAEAGRGEGFEYSLTLAVACLAIAIAGAGAYSLDAKRKRASPSP
jgi:putative oxidoreductase